MRSSALTAAEKAENQGHRICGVSGRAHAQRRKILADQAILTSERRPGRGTLPTILLAISSDAVAAGEGALQT